MPDPRRSEVRVLFLILGVFIGLGLTFWGVSEFLSGAPRGVGGGSVPIVTGGGGGEGEGVGQTGGGAESESEEPTESEGGGEGEGESGEAGSSGGEDLTEAEKILQESLLYAEDAGRHLFLHFTAPWCPGCWQLAEFLETPEITTLLERGFTLAEIDLETTEGAKSLFGELTGGGSKLPWIALFNPNGELVTTTQSAEGNLPFPPETAEDRARFLALFEKAGALSPEELESLGRILDDNLRVNLR